MVLTHDHIDHSEGVQALRERFPAPLAAGRGPADIELQRRRPSRSIRSDLCPGHAPDHFAFIMGGACFAGDAVLGEGSVFIAPDPGASSVTSSAGRLARARAAKFSVPVTVLQSGHRGSARPSTSSTASIASAGLSGARRRTSLDRGTTRRAWPDVPAALRPMAAVSLAAHLDKLGRGRTSPATVCAMSAPLLAR